MKGDHHISHADGVHFSSIPENGIGEVPQISRINIQCCAQGVNVHTVHQTNQSTSLGQLDTA